MEDSIIRFIERQTCVSVCCVDEEGKPHCFACFYAFDSSKGLLYFKSSPESRHMQLLLRKPAVSGIILPDKPSIWVTQGLQFHGTWLPAEHPSAGDASQKYHGKYPFALAIRGEVSAIHLQDIKMASRRPIKR